MSYNNNIPQPTDFIDESQPQLLSNFTNLDSVMAINHYEYSDTSGNAGKHRFLQLPEQASVPSTSVNEGALYVKESSSIANLFFRQESSGSEFQLTGPSISVSTKGHTFLPGGLILNWGTVTSTSSGSETFSLAFPNACFGVYTNAYFTGANPNGAAGIAVKTPIALSSFNWVFNSNSGAYSGFQYCAIGH